MRSGILDILVVDDDPVDAIYVDKLLSRSVGNVVCKHEITLSAGIAAASRFPIDLALLDLSLPDSSGLDTIAEFHRKVPHVPIVVLTGLQDIQLEIKVVDAGADDFLAKDHLTSDTLARCIRYLLDRRAANELLRQREAELAHVSRVHAVSEMASAIVHELTAPLSVIGNLAAASLNRIESGDVTQVTQNTKAVVEEAYRASDTIQRLRNFIRHGQVQHATVSMETLVRDALRLAEREARHADITLTLEIQSDLPPVIADTVQVQQVVLNLVRNAMQAMAKTPRPREVTIRLLASDQNFIETRVCDSGQGLDSGTAEDCFTPFFTTRADGVGLGLSISRTIAEAHGGRITASANQGPGMEFCFTLPAARSDSQARSTFQQ